MRHFLVPLGREGGTAEVRLGSGRHGWVRQREAAARASVWALRGGTGGSVMQVPHLHPCTAQGRFAEGRDMIMCWSQWSLAGAGDAAGLE